MTSVIENTMKYLTSLKEEFVSNMIFFLILVIIIFMLWYFFYMRNLAARECSRMDSLYKKLDGNLRSINSNIICPEALKTTFAQYRKPHRIQIWFTEKLLGWQWEDAK